MSSATTTSADEFPTTMAGFGYHFNEQGELRSREGEKFVFEVRKGDVQYNQKHYEALGERITEYVYEILEKECSLIRAAIPVDAGDGEPESCVYHSEDLETNDGRLMVLINGSGVVRAGQWARRLIINENLASGTQIPYIKRAMGGGCSVLVLNTNENFVVRDGKFVNIRGSGTPEEHAHYVFEHVVAKSPAREVFVVGHSYGGNIVISLAMQQGVAYSRITKVALTDSSHSLYSLAPEGVDVDIGKWMAERTVNWVTSEAKVGTVVERHDGLRTLSAGVMVHEKTSHTAFDGVFDFFADDTWQPPKPCGAPDKSDSERTPKEDPVVEAPPLAKDAEEPSVEVSVAAMSLEEPPVKEPCAEEPSVKEPCAEEPPIKEPSAEEPPIKEPCAEEPPIKESPVQEDVST